MSKKQKTIVGIGISTFLLIILGISYAWLNGTFYGKKKISVASGKLELLIDNENEGITVNNGVPTYDSDGKESTPYTFTLRNTGNTDVRYEMYLDNDEAQGETTLKDVDIRYQLKRLDSEKVNNLVGTRLIDTGTLKKGDSRSYELRLWLNINAGNDEMGKAFYGKIRVEAIQERASEDTSKANEPKLASNMIPVEYDGSNWVKAGKNTWYDYDQQKWANAVTVSSETREKYKNANAGATIDMTDINTMWVWIPRYSYTIAGDGINYYGKKGVYIDSEPTQALPGEIDIKFVDKSTKDSGTAKYIKTDKISEWYTPDAFTFDGKELSGIWVGKFETSNLEKNYDSDSSLTPIIKPKVTSWRSIRVSTLESVALNMNQDSNIYGFVESEVDSHAMKGSEWALAAYLSQSRYGKLGNRSYTGENKEIYMNAYTGYRTGCSYGNPTFPTGSGEQTCSHDYDELEDRGEGTGSAGGGASTIGNIYGIYDMNGGAWEYVMSNFNGYTGNTESLNSGYNGLLTDGSFYDKGEPYPDQKYYDKYLNLSTNILSHAMGETVGWYGDYSNMVSSTYPWQIRGGYLVDSSNAGVFRFSDALTSGGSDGNVSFRLVLVNM